MSNEYLAHLRMRLTQTIVPPGLHDGLVNFIGARRPVGRFLTAVLENDLAAAIGRADADSQAGLSRIVCFLVNYAPTTCWGSPDAVRRWLADPAPAPEVFE